MFDVIIKTLDGGNYEFSVEDEITVSEFKTQIESRINVPVNQQRLIFQGRLLQDDARLLGCGVQGKVVHLVPRPPPSAQAPEHPEPPPSVTPSGGGAPWGAIDIQQAIQDITAGIFSGLGDFTRNISAGTSNQDSGQPAVRTSALAARKLAFDGLHRQASRVLREAVRTYRSAQGSPAQSETLPDEATGSAVAPSDAAPSETETHNEPVPPLTDTESSSQSSPHHGSPMAVDSTTVVPQDRTQSNEEAEEEQSGTASSVAAEPQISTDRSLSSLANMLHRYRCLWQSAEPYFKHWETMLNRESRMQQTSVACAENAEPDVDISGQSTSSNLNENGHSGDSSPHIWQPRFFTQMSSLLHLNAHMLHLLSDFTAVRLAHARGGTHGASDVTQPSVAEGAGAGAGPTVTQSSANRDDTTTREATTSYRTERVLSVPENDTHLIRTRINIDPVLSFERLPPSTEATRAGGNRVPTYVPPDRRRSQSAADPNRRASAVPDRDVVVTPSTGQPMASFSPFRPGGTAIIHRVDIPVISMNMINLPVPSTDQPSTTTTATATATTGLVTTSASSIGSRPPPFVPTPPRSNIEVTTTSDANRSTRVTTTTTPTAALRPLSAVGAVDPFLPCHSRHFDSGHRPRLTSLQGSFSVPLVIPPMTVMPHLGSVQTERNATTRTGGNDHAESSESAAAGMARSTPSTTSASAAPGLPSFIPASLTEQIASFVSAATNAATSAAFVGGLDMNPFNVFMSSSPVQFTVNPNRPASMSTAVPETTASSDSTAEQLTTPAWADPATPPTDVPAPFPMENRILNVFMSSLIETVWLQLSSLATAQNTATEGLPELSGHFTVPQRSDPPPVASGLFTDILNSARRQLRSRPPGHLLPSSLNDMRVRLRHLVGHASRVLGDGHVTDALADLVFDGYTTDESVGTSGSSEAQFIAWAKRQIAKLLPPGHLVDVRASLVRLFKTDLNAQLELWNTSPTNAGFGSALLLTLVDCCVDLLCLTDLLVSRIGTALGLRPTQTLNGTAPGAPARMTLLNTTYDFSHLRSRLDRFAENLSDSTASVPFFELLLDGIRHCIDRYTNIDMATLTRRVDRLQDTTLVFRRPSSLSTPRMEIDAPNSGSGDDVDMEDLPFLDASSELPVANSSTELPSCPPGTVPCDDDDSRPTTDLNPALPDSKTVAAAHGQPSLDPHPDSARSYGFEHAEPAGWHAVLPAEWVDVVASDVARMARQMATDRPGGREHFSDAYIAGMPAKRRKLMKDHSCSLVKAPDAFLADCLSDAIHSVPGRAAAANSAAPTTPSSASGQLRQSDRKSDLVLALRDLVSSKLSDRLASDPNFDPAQFPLSNKAFGRKSV